MEHGTETRNAIIRETFLGMEDHGIMTAYLRLEWDGGGQSFGGYAFGSFSNPISSPFGMEFVRRVLDVVGVEQWEQLKGKHVRMRGDWSKVEAIGNIVKDAWFDPSTIGQL